MNLIGVGFSDQAPAHQKELTFGTQSLETGLEVELAFELSKPWGLVLQCRILLAITCGLVRDFCDRLKTHYISVPETKHVCDM